MAVERQTVEKTQTEQHDHRGGKPMLCRRVIRVVAEVAGISIVVLATIAVRVAMLHVWVG
jgi:hypothetical protein